MIEEILKQRSELLKAHKIPKKLTVSKNGKNQLETWVEDVKNNWYLEKENGIVDIFKQKIFGLTIEYKPEQEQGFLVTD